MLSLRHESSTRKWIAAFVLVALVCLYWMVSEASAGNKKSNPSAQGAANGVAHRVAALEAAQAETDEAILALTTAVADLQGQVADLESRVAALETAAVPAP
jgi:hypothetical protein